MAADRLQVVADCALVACVYYLMGFIGIQSAIPPGYATLVWPSSGLALAAAYAYGAKILPGVWLGSFLVNLFVRDWTDAMVPATGAVAQAALGGWLMRRYLREGWMWRSRGLLAFFGIAAAVSWVNSVWSPILLRLDLPEHPLSAQIRTWWVGDAVGACLLTPLLVFLAGEKDEHA